MAQLFKNLNLLYFLPLAVLPLLLHLITVYRLRTVELSTFRFLMASYVQQRRRVRLLEWLLMLLRTAFVALIIFAVSRPELRGLRWLPGSGTGGEVDLVVDAGPTMNLRSGGTSSLERARTTAAAIVRLLGPDCQVTVVRAADRPEVLITRFAAGPDPILDQIQRIEAADAESDLPAALELLFPPGAPDHPRRIYIVTDGQQSRWRRLAAHPVLARIGPASQLAVIDIGPTEPVVNLAVSAAVPDQGLAPIVGLPVMLDATVANCSKDQPAQTVLSVVLDGRQVQRINLALSPGQRAVQRLALSPPRAGLIQGRLELPADAFGDDDCSLFCLSVQPRVSVLLVAAPPGEDRAASSRLFLEAALAAPVDAAAPESADAKAIAAALGVRTVGPDAVSAEELDRSDVVVLADAALDEAAAQRVRAFVESGGGLLVLPGPQIQPASVSQHLLGATGLTLGEPVGEPDDESTFQPLAELDLDHPVLRVFAPQPQGFSSARLYRYYPIQAAPAPNGGPPGAGIRTLIRLADRTVALAETRLGDGRILLAGFPGSPDWSNLPLQGRFVPLVLRAVAGLCRPAAARVPASVRPNQPAPILLAERWAQAQVQVVDPAGTPHTIPMVRSGRQFGGVMRDTGRRGYYTVRVTAPGSEAAERLELGFAVNLDREPDDLAMLDAEGFRALFARPDLAHLRGVPADPVLAQRLTEKREIWRWLIGVMFAVILLELFLATLRPGAAPARDEEPAGLARRVGRGISQVMDRAGLWVALPRPAIPSADGRGAARPAPDARRRPAQRAGRAGAP